MQVRVLGSPAPKGSYRPITVNGKTRLIPASKGEKKWRAAVSQTCEGLEPLPAKTPLKCELIFTMRRPKTVKRPRPTVPPDLDKLCRCTLDGLQDAHILPDDAQIVELHAEEHYGPRPGAFITVEAI